MLKESRDELLSTYVDQGPYVATDGLFTVDHIEGSESRGLDAVHIASGDRIFFTCERDEAAEERLIRELGEKAILPYMGTDGRAVIYRVPAGARLIAKVLETEAYTPEFMARLRGAAQNFLDKVAYLDKDRFGLNIESLAIVPNVAPSDDPAIIMAVPPLQADTGEKGIS